MRIWVDADACPSVIKDIPYRAAERVQVEMTLLRSSGVQTGGPAPLDQSDRKRFADQLNRFLAARAELMLKHLRVLTMLALAALPALAGEPSPLYSVVPLTSEGVGKAYMGREIARVMTYHGAPWLERVERTKEERPDLVIAALELKPGMAVADVGAGSGYYSRRFAELVGKSGVVYAVDIQPEMLKLIERDAARHKLGNVKPVLATATDPKLPAASLDLAVMVDVYHELEFPHEVMAALVAAIRPGGRLALVEFRANDPGVPIRRLHTMSEEQVRREMASHPLEWVKTVRDLPWQQVIVFTKRR